MITSMIATVIASMIATVIASKAWLSLSLAIVAMVIAMKTLWAPVVVAGGMMTISISWLRVSLSLVIISSIVTIVTIVTMGVEAVAVGARMVAMVSLSYIHGGRPVARLSL